MNFRLRGTCVMLFLVLLGGVVTAEELVRIALPAPQMHGGKPLMDALALRATSRAFASDRLPLQTLSSVLWAACGINRPEKGLHTAPAAVKLDTDVYVVMESGAYIYNPKTNALDPVVAGDYRILTGTQAFVKDAPVTLVYVANASRMRGEPDSIKVPYEWANASFISENVYLFAASEGLATGVRASIDRPTLANVLRLNADQSIIMAQCVGYPKK